MRPAGTGGYCIYVSTHSRKTMVWNGARHSAQRGGPSCRHVHTVSMTHRRQQRAWPHGCSSQSGARARHTAHASSSPSSAPLPPHSLLLTTPLSQGKDESCRFGGCVSGGGAELVFSSLGLEFAERVVQRILMCSLESDFAVMRSLTMI